MIREFKVAANIGKPQVSYRETIRRAAEGNGRFVRQTGGKGQYGHAVIKLEPAEKGAGYEFVDKIVGGTIPREYIKPVDQGIRETLATGIYAGFPVVDVKVDPVRRVVPRRRLVRDGVQDRRLDGRQGRLRQGRPGHPRADHEGRGPRCPRSSWATSSATSTAAAARSRAWSRAGTTQVVRAFVPLAQMFGYVTDLRQHDPGPGDVLDGIQSLRRGAGQPGLGTRPEVQGLAGSREQPDGQEEVRAHQAARQHRHDRPHRPRQDEPDRGDHQVPRPEGRGRVPRLRLDRQRARGARARASPSPSPTSSTRPTPATTPTSTARATPTTSRT